MEWWWRRGGVRWSSDGGKVGDILDKGYFTGKPKTTSNRVITTITLMLATETKVNATNRPSGEFGAFMDWEENIASAPKSPEHGIIRASGVKFLMW